MSDFGFTEERSRTRKQQPQAFPYMALFFTIFFAVLFGSMLAMRLFWGWVTMK